MLGEGGKGANSVGHLLKWQKLVGVCNRGDFTFVTLDIAVGKMEEGDVCVVDDECVTPAEMAEMAEEAIAGQEADRIYSAQTAGKGNPVVDLPDLDTDTGPLMDDTPWYVTAAFAAVCQNGTGDPNKALYTLPKYIERGLFNEI